MSWPALGTYPKVPRARSPSQRPPQLTAERVKARIEIAVLVSSGRDARCPAKCRRRASQADRSMADATQASRRALPSSR